MRARKKWLLSATVALGLGGPAWGQSTSLFGNTSTGPLQYQIVSTTDPNSPVARPQNVSSPTNPQRFFNSSSGKISNQQVIGKSVFPTGNQMPGDGYFKSFNMQVYQTKLPWWRRWGWGW